MAWNEPGGGPGGNSGGGRDPWGNRNDQGPPDLDEAFRKLQAQLSGDGQPHDPASAASATASAGPPAAG